MSIRSETIIHAPHTKIWDSVEEGWYDLAPTTPFRPNEQLETQFDIPTSVPEVICRKLGDKLLISMLITHLNPPHDLRGLIENDSHLIPTIDLSIFLEPQDTNTHMSIRGEMDPGRSLRKKLFVTTLSPFLTPLVTHGLSRFKDHIEDSKPDELREAS